MDWVVYRSRQSRLADGVSVVTSEASRDDAIADLATGLGVDVFRGSEQDVLDRYASAARYFGADAVVRITGDCPFVDPGIIDEVIQLYRHRPADYVCIRGYPEGVGAAELVRLSALARACEETTAIDVGHREHVVTFLTEHPESFALEMPPAALHLQRPRARFSIDTWADLARARDVAAYFAPSRDFSIADLLAWLDRSGAGVG